QYPGFAGFLYSKSRLFVRIFHLVLAVGYTILLSRKVKIDAVHGWNPLAGLAAVLSKKILGCQVFVDLTDFYSDIAKTDSPSMVSFFNFIERYILSAAEKVVVVSTVMRDFLSQYYNVSKDKIYIIPDGTDKEKFNPLVDGTKVRNSYMLGSNPTLIYHGDIKSPDGVDILLEAFKLVLKKIPNAKLLIVGGGGSYFQRLKIHAKNLKRSVIFAGWVPHEAVPEYIAASDLGVMPLRSTLNHNCYVSFKLFEYWGVGKPVVVSGVKAISEIVRNGINGVLVKPEDVKSLADGILAVLNDLGKARLMGDNGRRLVEEKYNWNSLMVTEAKLYKIKK
ncbi:MAG: glycosyltransferase family 4 protein, partial [Candidatus Bathyarchaeota archaeon]